MRKRAKSTLPFSLKVEEAVFTFKKKSGEIELRSASCA